MIQIILPIWSFDQKIPNSNFSMKEVIATSIV